MAVPSPGHGAGAVRRRDPDPHGEFGQYQQDGYLVVEGARSGAEVDRVRGRIREYTHGDREPPFRTMREPAVEEGGVDVDEEGDAVRKFEGLDMVREDDVFRDLAHHESVVPVATDLLGPHVKLRRSAAMLKPPRIGSQKGLHQDAAYYPHDHLTVRIALDEATPANGCMTVVPGAHTDGLIEHETVDYDTDITSPSPTTTTSSSDCRWNPAARCSPTARCPTAPRRTPPTRGAARTSTPT